MHWSTENDGLHCTNCYAALSSVTPKSIVHITLIVTLSKFSNRSIYHHFCITSTSLALSFDDMLGF